MKRIGPYEISVHIANRFRLDGGAMFGSVPKTLWERQIKADERNRIQLACRLLLLRSAEHTVLIDLGCGSKWSPKETEIYAVEEVDPRPLAERLPEVTDIILTHLHFDHVGGVSYRDADGELKLSFPDAVHYVQEENWQIAQKPGPRERATYLPENLEPLAKANLRLTKDGEEILPGIRVFKADGHTRGLQWILIGKEDDAVVWPSDVIPTAHHLPIPYVMGYDLWAEKTMDEKDKILQRAVQNNWLMVFGHDAETAAGRIGKDDRGRYCLKEKVDLKVV